MSTSADAAGASGAGAAGASGAGAELSSSTFAYNGLNLASTSTSYLDIAAPLADLAADPLAAIFQVNKTASI